MQLMDNKSLIELTEMFCGEFYFIRHGETDWNKQGLLMGHMDIPLNQTGIAQAKLAQQKLMHHEIGAVFSSPLQRAYETAKIIIGNKNNKIQLLHGLKERGFPSGSLHDDLEHITTDNLPTPFEKWSEFSTRVAVSLDYVLAQKTELTSLIVAHGGVLVAICMALNIKLPSTANCLPLKFSQNHEGLWEVKSIA